MEERKLNILVVDDEQIVLDSVKRLLRRENCTVHGTLSAEEGLAVMEATKMDIVLTDLMLPEIDGLEFMEMVKKRSPHMPVIMITGYATINTALQATHLGAFDYVAKPFTRAELLSVLKRAANLVRTAEKSGKSVEDAVREAAALQAALPRPLKTIGENSWMMLEDDGVVLMGAELGFLQTVGGIKSIYLPAEGDDLRQGGVYLQIVSEDLRSHTALSPLSGAVVSVNQRVLDDPSTTLEEDPYGEGWLIRLKPSRFEFEIKTLGL